MRRIVIAVLTTVSGLVMLFSYHTSTNSGGVALPVGGTGPGAGTTGTSPSLPAPRSQAQPPNQPPDQPQAQPPAGGSGSPGFHHAGTFTGGPAETRWGVVQVQITVQGGRIVDSQAIQYPNNNFRDQEINSIALPALHQQVLDAQSANIDGVSGATVTSGGYIASLQAAVDAAHQ